MPRHRTAKNIAFVITALAVGALTVAFALPQTTEYQSSMVASDLTLPPVEPLSIRQNPLVYNIAVEDQDTLTRTLLRAGNIGPELPLHFQRDPAASRAARQLRARPGLENPSR